MIRVNLLPQKRRQQSGEGGQLWLLAVVLLVAAEAVGLLVFHAGLQGELTKQQRTNRTLETEIAQSRSAVKDHEAVKGKLEQLRAREDAIAKLQSARTGPTAILLEVARLLTPGRGPSIDPDRLAQIRRENPLAMYSPNWDSRRLWISRFVEDKRKVKLGGTARDGEDVSELARRMNLSSYFSDVRLLPASKKRDAATDLDLVSFQLEAEVKY